MQVSIQGASLRDEIQTEGERSAVKLSVGKPTTREARLSKFRLIRRAFVTILFGASLRDVSDGNVSHNEARFFLS